MPHAYNHVDVKKTIKTCIWLSKHLEGTDGLFEIRIKVGSNNFRVFCFFDKGNLIIILNGFQKKTDKTPKNEIDKAERLKQKYHEEQQNN